MAGGSESMGKSQSRSKSVSQGTSSSQQSSFVDPSQQGYLDLLRQQGVNQFQQSRPGFAEMLGKSQGLVDQGQGFLNSLTTPGGGISESRQALGGFKAFGGSADSQLLGQDASQGVIDQLGADVARQLERQIGGAGGIGSEFGLAGGRGGGRDQVQRGIAQEGAIDAFSRGAAGIRQQDLQNRQQLDVQQQIANLQAGLQGSGQELSAMQSAGGLASQEEVLRQQGLASGFEGLQGLFNLGMGGLGSQFAPFQFLSGLLGDPTVLQQGTSDSQQTARAKAKALAWNQSSSFQFGAGG